MIIDGLNDLISKLLLERINNPQNEVDLEISNKYNLYIQWGYTPTLAIGALSGNYAYWRSSLTNALSENLGKLILKDASKIAGFGVPVTIGTYKNRNNNEINL